MERYYTKKGQKMAFRKQLSKKGSKKLFTATSKPKARNFMAEVKRGGTRL